MGRPRTDRSGAVRVISLAVLVAVVSTAVAFGVGKLRADDEPAAAPMDAATQQAVADAVSFVESHRGLRFRRPPKVTVLADKAFIRQLSKAQSGAEDRKALQDWAAMIRAYGLVGDGGDPMKLLDALLAGGVGGYYDSEAEQLFIRAGAMTPTAKATIVHELVHALEDQHFDLDRPELESRDDDSESAFQFLAEGSARYVENQYRATFTAAEQREAAAEESAMADTGDLMSLISDPAYIGALPYLLTAMFAPYEQGKEFVRQLVESGGTSALDRAYARPPRTTEQATDVDAYRNDERAVNVRRPAVPKGARIITAGTTGEAGLDALVATPASIMAATDHVSAAASGWGGDSTVVWRQGATYCVRMDLVMDTAKDLDEAAAAIREMLPLRRGAVEIRGDKALRYSSCSA